MSGEWQFTDFYDSQKEYPTPQSLESRIAKLEQIVRELSHRLMRLDTRMK